MIEGQINPPTIVDSLGHQSRPGRVCVAIGEANCAAALAVALKVEELADVIEIRLDCLADPALEPFLSHCCRPLLFTNRPAWEGGNYRGPESSRIDLLEAAVIANTAYIDLELEAPAQSHARIAACRPDSTTQLIISHHNFTTTPSRDELLAILRGMKDHQADIGKIITTAADHHEVLRVLQLQEDAAAIQLPLIAFCMGRAGLISRLATLELGGYMTYCAAAPPSATAPGQLPVGLLRELLERLEI